MVPYDTTLQMHQKLVPNNTGSYNDDSSENKNVTYNNLYNNQSLPLVTPNDTYRSIITQHHLNQIQRNIFLPNDAVRDEKVDLLHAQMQRLQQHLEETERKKKKRTNYCIGKKNIKKQSKKHGLPSCKIENKINICVSSNKRIDLPNIVIIRS
jgi:hypothetical protein